MESTQLQFEQFLFEWREYKKHYGLSRQQASTTLFFSCSEEIRTRIRTRQKILGLEDACDESDLLNLIKEITTSRMSPIVHIRAFLQMKQEESESCEDFKRRLELKASCCEFLCDTCQTSNIEKRVKEKFILGLKNKAIQTQVLKTESMRPGTPLNIILTEANTLEQTMLDQALISNDSPSTICKINEENKNSMDEVNAMIRRKSFPRNNVKSPKVCYGCGTNEHRFNERSTKCRAWGAKCSSCGMVGHFAKVCRKQTSQRPNVSLAESNELSCFFIGEVSSLHLPVKVKPLGSTIFVSGPIVVDAFPDTGANICLIGPHHLEMIKVSLEQLNQCSHHISVAGGSNILATGWFRVVIILGEKSSEQKVYFSAKAKRFFLSRQTCIEL